MKPIKYWNLERWDRAIHWDEILTFQKVDWMYVQWLNDKWEMKVWNALEYEKRDWIYYPI